MKIYKEAVGWEWRNWFAWRPIKTQDGIVVWLEVIQRKYFDCPIPNVIPNTWIIYRRIK